MECFGLIGEKLSHSLSPDIHKRVFEELNIRATYNLFSVKKEAFNKVIESLKTLGVKGVNVTIPYKEDIIRQLDYISPEAKAIGAVNTVLMKDGKALGYNTDYYGFGEMLKRERIQIQGKRCYVLGAGGAARAVAEFLKDQLGKVTIVSRDIKSAKHSFRGYNIIDYKELECITQGDIIVNTTPCGMYPNIETIAVSDEVLKKFNTAVDIVYNPLETRFLKRSKELGLKVVEGLYMLIGQGLKAEEIWNDIVIDSSIGELIIKEIREKLECK